MAIDLNALRAKHAELSNQGGSSSDFLKNFLRSKKEQTLFAFALVRMMISCFMQRRRSIGFRLEMDK